jgi:hypothetical protein
MLERARKRNRVNLWYQLQAGLDAPMVKLSQPYPGLQSAFVLTRGDAALVLVAVAIHANGFALGLVLGKVTAAPFREIFCPPVAAQIIILPLWPVLWAIGLDQIL